MAAESEVVMNPEAKTPAPEGKTTGEGSTPKKEGGGSPDGKDSGFIPLSRKEYDELVAAKAKLEGLASEHAELKETWNQAQVLLNRDETTGQERVIQATRHVLKKAGHSDEAIEEYLRASNVVSGESEKNKKEPEETPLEGRLKAVEAQQSRETRQRVAEKFQAHTEMVLTANVPLVKLIDSLVGARSVQDGKAEEVKKSIRETVLDDVRKETRDALYARRDQAKGAWDDRWIAEEAARAADTVAKRWTTVLGDPSKIGRVPVGGPEDTEDFLSSKPLEMPKFERGTNMAERTEKITEWMTDGLLRAVRTPSKETAV